MSDPGITIHVHVRPQTRVVAEGLRNHPETVTVDVGDDVVLFVNAVSVETLIGALTTAREILAPPAAKAAA